MDALASLRPDLLDQIARQALDGFYDRTLAGRVARYRSEWLDRARELIAATFDMDQLGQIRRDAEEQLDSMRSQIRELNDALRIEVDEDDVPPIDLPEADDPGGNGLPLLDSRWDSRRRQTAPPRRGRVSAAAVPYRTGRAVPSARLAGSMTAHRRTGGTSS